MAGTWAGACTNVSFLFLSTIHDSTVDMRKYLLYPVQHHHHHHHHHRHHQPPTPTHKAQFMLPLHIILHAASVRVSSGPHAWARPDRSSQLLADQTNLLSPHANGHRFTLPACLVATPSDLPCPALPIATPGWSSRTRCNVQCGM